MLTGGLPKPVVLDLSGLPDGANAIWSTNPVTSDDTAVLTIETSYTTMTGTYTLTVTGSSEWIEHSLQALLVVEPAQLPVIDHCGTITADEVWGPGVVHRITCDVVVNNGVTLTLQADTIVKILSEPTLTVLGTLNVKVQITILFT